MIHKYRYSKGLCACGSEWNEDEWSCETITPLVMRDECGYHDRCKYCE